MSRTGPSSQRRLAAAGSRARALACTVLGACASASLQASPAQDYMLHCMGCHGPTALGIPGKVPPLASTLTRFMRAPAGRDYVLRVPGAANSALSDEQLAAVLNWVATTFGESLAPSTPFTTSEVARARHTPLPSVLAARAAVVRELAATGPAPSANY